jgi:type IV pilus assembly protein PilY1
VLDVTDPADFATAASLVKLDRTRSTDSAMGASIPNCALTGISATEATACVAAVAEDRDIGNITAPGC